MTPNQIAEKEASEKAFKALNPFYEFWGIVEDSGNPFASQVEGKVYKTFAKPKKRLAK